MLEPSVGISVFVFIVSAWLHHGVVHLKLLAPLSKLMY